MYFLTLLLLLLLADRKAGELKHILKLNIHLYFICSHIKQTNPQYSLLLPSFFSLSSFSCPF
jgi:hypothetical protein